MRKNKNSELHQLSKDYLAQTSLTHRKKLGQYFTPKTVREQLLSLLPQIKSPKVLDPACGSGEFLLSASQYWKDASLNGWDIDSKLVKIARAMNPEAYISKKDSLVVTNETDKYDFIIGNPPYFEMKLSEKQKKQYHEILGGRMNIFSLFIKRSIELLKDNGYLGFVVPPSMNNGAYFSKLRKFIINHSDIQHLKVISSSSIFSNAQQQVMILILKKQNNTKKYVFTKNNISIFSPNKERLQQTFLKKSTLFEAGFTVKTGSIVWNNNKEKLTNSAQKGKLLIWAHNIGKEKLTLHNSQKPQYIISKTEENGPVILVNRVTGTSANTKIKAVLVPKSLTFLAENHVNIIYPPATINGKKVSISLLKSIAKQISSDKTEELVGLISGNTQLSKTELWKLIPLDI